MKHRETPARKGGEICSDRVSFAEPSGSQLHCSKLDMMEKSRRIMH